MPVLHTDGSNPPMTTAALEPYPIDKGLEHRMSMHRWALWSINNHAHFTYTQGPERWHMVESAPGTLPQFCDCSSFVTGLAKWAGATDPNGLHYMGGYTGTLLNHCNRITKTQARMGDLIVYGPGTGHHVVMVLERIGTDLAVASHGHQGNPGRYLNSRFLAYFGANSAQYLRWLS